jgi:RNA polymerase sigma factor (sigma-70 family)
VALRNRTQPDFRTLSIEGFSYALTREFHSPESLKENTSAVDDPSSIPSRRAAAPLENLEQAEFRELLRRKLELLPELERDVIALKFTDGLSNAEIAKVLDITPNHLGVVLFRALQKLRGSMAESC